MTAVLKGVATPAHSLNYAGIRDSEYCLRRAAELEDRAHRVSLPGESAALLDAANRWFRQAEKIA